jgi:lipopolysaccharide biosynthesis glycosyltransferase
MQIVLASDNNYAEFVAVVIVSAIANNSGFIHFHLLSNGIGENTIRQLQTHIPSGRGELHVYDIHDLRDRLQIDVPDTIAISSYARLFLPSILPTDIPKVLYLDCDTVISGDISVLWNTPLHDKYIAGVLDTLPDCDAKINISLREDEPYLNSGVLLINLDLWRKDDLQKRFIDFLLEHNGQVYHHDQGIINGVCIGKVQIVHPRYNCTSNYYSHPYTLLRRTNTPFYSEQEYMEATAHPAILHFTEGFYNRPWIANSLHPMAAVFYQYHNMTAWSNAPLRKDKRSWLVRFLSWEFLHLPYSVYQFTAKCVTKLADIIKQQ